MKEIMIAGFGGQGVLSLGVMLANSGLRNGKNVTWLPSYGSEQRGGTANCFVKIDDEEVASPYVDESDILITLNEPSYVKFKDKVKKGGYLFVNSSLVYSRDDRTDIHVVRVPVTELATEFGDPRVANVMMLGVILAHTDLVALEVVDLALSEYFASKGEKVIAFNKKALRAGYQWKETDESK